MDQINILEDIFSRINDYFVLKKVCRLWYHVCERIIQYCKTPSAEIIWYQSHLKMKSLHTCKDFITQRPKGKFLKKHWSCQKGLMVQLFHYQKTIASQHEHHFYVYLTDYTGLRIGREVYFDGIKNFFKIKQLKCTLKTIANDDLMCISLAWKGVKKFKCFLDLQTISILDEQEIQNIDYSLFKNHHKQFWEVNVKSTSPSIEILLDCGYKLFLRNIHGGCCRVEVLFPFIGDISFVKSYNECYQFDNHIYLLGFNEFNILLNTETLGANRIPKNHYAIKCSKTQRLIEIVLITPKNESSHYKANFVKFIQ